MNDQNRPRSQALDPILEARLDLLNQVLDEVQNIRDERKAQKDRLAAVQRFLKPDGDLNKLRNDAGMGIEAAVRRLRNAIEINGGSADPDDPTEQALELLTSLQPDIDVSLRNLRSDAFREFLGIQEWTIAALNDTRLGKAQALYRASLNAIGEAQRPWAKYEEQLHGRGETLFNAYLELLSSIAVRGLRIADDLADDRQALLKVLLGHVDHDQLPQLPTPNLLTRSEHIQLGYLGWNLWALPLIGKDAGLYLIRTSQDSWSDLAARHHVVCADAFATYVLGPSYVAATIFLELDPDGTSTGGAPADPVRAELLLDLLPELATEPQRRAIEAFVGRLRAAWQAARTAIGAPQIEVSDEVRDVTRKFREEVAYDYPQAAYDMETLPDQVADAERFVTGDAPATSNHPRDVLVAMWWARVNHPESCRVIDDGARKVMAATGQGPGVRNSARSATSGYGTPRS
ncbi:hypothetical protein [Nocardioides sp.]|uniref:hypothetical protein n=1 Tax=Nocardioides sp. TaxID=35761 RepID=UPI003D122418